MRDHVTILEAENAQTLHTLLTPFRLLIQVIQIMVGTVILIGFVTFTFAGWIFNGGEYSLENRRERVCDPAAYLSPCNLPWYYYNGEDSGSYVYRLDFTHSGSDNGYGLAASYDKTQISENTGPSPAYEALPGDFDTTPRKWINLHGTEGFFERSDDSFRRKSARMRIALRDADNAVSRARSAVAFVKYGGTGRESAAQDHAIRLPHAPVLLVRYVRLPHGTSEIEYSAEGISGYCLVGQCDADGSDLRFYLTKYRDILDKMPPLAPHQLDAITALERTTTEGFWLEAAHDNGVHDDALIRSLWEHYNAERESN